MIPHEAFTIPYAFCTNCGAKSLKINDDGDWSCVTCSRWAYQSSPPRKEHSFGATIKRPLIESGTTTRLSYSGHNDNYTGQFLDIVLLGPAPGYSASSYAFICPFGEGHCVVNVKARGIMYYGERRWPAKCTSGHKVKLIPSRQEPSIPRTWQERGGK